MSAARDEYNELIRDKERRTAHPEDDKDRDDDARSFLNLSDDDGDTTPPASCADPPLSSTSIARSTIPVTRYGANTGPKGVISDAQDFRDSRRSQRTSLRSTASLAMQALSMSIRDKAPVEKLEEEEDDGDDLVDLGRDDNHFMKKWRQSRLEEMQSGTRDSSMHKIRRQRRLYGALTMVDPEGYLDAVDNAPPDTVVVVYIYDDYVSSLRYALAQSISNL